MRERKEFASLGLGEQILSFNSNPEFSSDTIVIVEVKSKINFGSVKRVLKTIKCQGKIRE